MLSNEIKSSLLWKNAFSGNKKNEQIGKLKNSFISIREKVKDIVSLVIADFPDLTIHDITHLDKLWTTADFLINKNFSLNPLETYILGVSILLHDSALSYSVYKGGQDGIRNTIFWKDTIEELKRSSNKDIIELEKLADFITIRKFHADQAKETILSSWETVEGNLFFLVEDSDLRLTLGELCGEIAASHHLDIETVESKFKNIINAPAFLPRDWTIDALKIAIILRCSDAAHISNDRAPNFFYALLKRNGISFNHWQFQNRLSNPGYDYVENDMIVFNTSKAFSEFEQESWWLTFDTLTILDKEIKSSNKVLKLNRGIDLFAKGVKYIDYPDKLTSFVKTEGWIPKNISIHVSNIENLIRNLGGEKLYGGNNKTHVGIVLRELIQNSRDAIKAREKVDNDFESEYLNIKFEKTEEDIYLIVSDNGIGLSERVLFEVLLDFGKSFWSSSLLKDEFPGILSSGYKSIGKYGIGFYSVFMISDSVKIKTRNWNKGINDTIELDFNEKNILRPTFKKNSNSLPSKISTEITLKLKKDIFINNEVSFEINPQTYGKVLYHVPPEAYVANISIGLDCDVYYTNKIVHYNIEREFDIEKWLYNGTFTEYSPNVDKELIKRFLETNASRFRRIRVDGKTVGFGFYIFKHHDFLRNFHISTIGGLQTRINLDDSSASGFIGFLDGEPKDLTRNQGSTIKLKDELKKIFLDQLSKNEFDLENLNLIENNIFCSRLYSFNMDFWEYMNFACYINGQIFVAKVSKIQELFNAFDIGFIYPEGHQTYGFHYFGQEENISLRNDILYILPLQVNEFVLNSATDSTLIISKIKSYNPGILFEEIYDENCIGIDKMTKIKLYAKYLIKYSNH